MENPIKKSCDHCEGEVIDPAGECYLSWCPSCAEECKDIFEEKKIAYAGVPAGGECINWQDAVNVAKLKSIPKKGEETYPCAHCDKPLLGCSSLHKGNDSIVWCLDCCSEESEIFKQPRMQSVRTNFPRNWDWFNNNTTVGALKSCPKKASSIPLISLSIEEPIKEEKIVACDHCNCPIKESDLPAENKTNPLTLFWCKTCYTADDKILRDAGLHPGSNYCYGTNSRGWNSGALIAAAIPKKNEETIKAPKIEPIKTSEIKDHKIITSCDHCSKTIAVSSSDKTTWDVYWCGDCVNSDNALLKDIPIYRRSTYGNIARANANDDGGTLQYSGWSNCEKDVRAIPKKIEKVIASKIEKTIKEEIKKSASCDHCAKELDITKKHNYRDACDRDIEYQVYWCSDCCSSDENKLPYSATHNFGTEHQTKEYCGWALLNKEVRAIPKKQINYTCSGCSCSMKKVLQQDSSAIHLCLPCLKKNVEQIAAQFVPYNLENEMGGSWTSGDNKEKVLAIISGASIIKDTEKVKDKDLLTKETVEKMIEEAVSLALASSKEEKVEIKEPIKIYNCDHCSKEIKQVVSPGTICWCKECAISDRQILIDAGVVPASILPSTYYERNPNIDGEGWSGNGNIAALKTIPKKKIAMTETIKMAKCCVCEINCRDHGMVYSACPDCAIKIRDEKAWETSQATAKVIAENGDGFGAPWKREVDSLRAEIVKTANKLGCTDVCLNVAMSCQNKIRADFKEQSFKKVSTMGTPNGATSCVCCGVSCIKWQGNWENCCVNCAVKVIEADTRGSLSTSKETARRDKGMGFLASAYKDQIAAVKQVIDADKTKIEELKIKMIDKTRLKVGDQIAIIITDTKIGTTYNRDATVFNVGSNGVQVILSSPVETKDRQSWVISDKTDLAAVDKIGKVPGVALLGWKLDQNTEVSEVSGNCLPPEPPPVIEAPPKREDLKVGDKVEICWRSSSKEYFAEAVVSSIQGSKTYVAFKNGQMTSKVGEVIVKGYVPSYEAASDLEKLKLGAEYDFNYYLDSAMTATKLLGRMEMPAIDEKTLIIGDKVEVEVDIGYWEGAGKVNKQVRTGTVVKTISGDVRYLLDKSLVSASGSSPCFYIGEYPDCLNEAKRLNLPYSGYLGWRHNASNTKILRVIEKATPPIAHKDVVIGDRYETEVASGRIGTAIVIDIKDGAPILAFEKTPGMNLYSPNSSEHTLYQKYGIPIAATRWTADGNTKFRKRIDTAKTYLEHKNLVQGQVIRFTLRYGGQTHETQGVVANNPAVSGNIALTTNAKFAGLTGTPQGIYTNAAKMAGWDPKDCGTWSLQPGADQVSEIIAVAPIKTKAISDCKVGDLLEIEIVTNSTNLKTQALVATIGSGTLGLVFKERTDIAGNCDSNIKKIAEKYGFESEGTFYTISDNIAVIHRSLGKASLKTVPPAELEAGDRVEACFGHEGSFTAVVLQSAADSIYGEPILAFEAENNKCWALDASQKELALKYGLKGTKIGQRVDGHSAFVTKVLGKKSLSVSNLKPGDRISIGLSKDYEKSSLLPAQATVISLSGNIATLFLDEIYHDKAAQINDSAFPSATTKELAQKIGIDIADNDPRIMSISDNGCIIISEVIPKEEQEEKEAPEVEVINPNSIQLGDRLVLEVTDADGDIEERFATALGIFHNGLPLVFLDEELDNVLVFQKPENIEAVKSLGFDPKLRSGFEINPAKTKIIEILPEKHEIEVEDLHIGDRVSVELDAGYGEVGEVKEAVFLGFDEESRLGTFFFNEAVETTDWDSWLSEENSVPFLAAKELGLEQGEPNYLNLESIAAIRKIVLRATSPLDQEKLEEQSQELKEEKTDENLEEEEIEEEEEETEEETEEEEEEEIEASELSPGDKVSVKIVNSEDPDDFVIKEAVVIDPKHNNGPLLSLESTFKFDGDDAQPFTLKSLSKEIVKTAKRFGLNPERKVAWNVDDWTTITKVLGKVTETKETKHAAKENKMPIDENGDETSFMDTVKSDAVDAGYRVAATQMSKGIKNAMILAMKSKGVDGGKVAAVAEMLDTQMGEAAIATALGWALNYAPMFKDDPRAVRLAKEFRIGGMTMAGNSLMELAMEHLMPAIASTMANLPKLEDIVPAKKTARKRVAAPKDSPALEVENEGTETKAGKGAAV